MPTDTLPDLPGTGPVRTCVGCRERDLRSVLLRLVVDRSGTSTDEPRLVVDAGRSLPGRGAWVEPNSAFSVSVDGGTTAPSSADMVSADVIAPTTSAPPSAV
uniref:YlxR family protein n=1 Tax=Cellulosimicrobium cellulans TaxID=1710 RepID=UPI000A6BD83C